MSHNATHGYNQNSRLFDLLWPVFLAITTISLYSRLFHAGFSGLDDDIHVYSNPFLNPPTIASVKQFWLMPYRGLYIPLAYTFFAIIAHYSQTPELFNYSMGETLTVNPIAFHIVNIVVNALNCVLVYDIIRRISHSRKIAAITSLLFALHPMQVESVAWISEFRGLSGSFFALLALSLFVRARESTQESKLVSKGLMCIATFAFVCGMLCKPSIVALPIVIIAIDRIIYRLEWRKTLSVAVLWILCGIPFLAITHSIQQPVMSGASKLWERPFVAGDALAFYIGKVLLPINLCIDYGRTPIHLFEHWWAYFNWILPAVLFSLAYRYREQYRLVWLGTIIFAVLFLPVLGLVPFSFQNYSTVSDRYAYLSIIGIGLIFGDILSRIDLKAAVLITVLVCAILAPISFIQTKYWMSESDFLNHTIDINPNAQFAYTNLGQIMFGNKDYSAALNDYLIAESIETGHAQIDINIAHCYAALNEKKQALAMLQKAFTEPAIAPEDYSDLGNEYLALGDNYNGIKGLYLGVVNAPNRPSCIFNFAEGLLKTGHTDDAEIQLKKCIALAPSLGGPHMALGVAYAQTGHLHDAEAEFARTVELEPTDPTALQNLKQAQQLLASEQGAISKP